MSKLVLCIVDGLGYAPDLPNNPVNDHMPFFNDLLRNNPFQLLEASGEAVGLPDGQMGNSEVGHMTIGAGSTIQQDLLRIDNKLKHLAKHPVLDHIKYRCHILGLYSTGGVHSHADQIDMLVKYLANRGVEVFLHLFTDGRDVGIHSWENDSKRVKALLNDHVHLATVCGRYYAMDRDKRYERTEKALDAIIKGKGARLKPGRNGAESDEFIEPMVAKSYNGFRDGDSIIIANFRADRILQLLEYLSNLNTDVLATLTNVPRSYDHLKILFPKPPRPEGLGAWVAEHNLTQTRIAETEKYAHVTYFFNVGREKPYENEDRILIPSPKVATYDLQPEMSAKEVTDAVLSEIDKETDFIVVNYANPDMVGHTGVYEAACKALDITDECLKQVVEYCAQKNYTIIITSDHGNIEAVKMDDGLPHTSHTTNPVPLITIPSVEFNGKSLADIASLCKKILTEEKI